jgi:metallo-beta-lactamase class B
MHSWLPILAALLAQADPTSRSRNQPVEPFKLIGNIHYVGANEITSFLVTTPQGHILLDGGFVETVPQILANIRKLGFRPEDVKVLINSHAHLDHAGGFAELKSVTGASLAVMQGDAEQVARGGRGDFAFGDTLAFPAVQPDRVLHDGDLVALGGTTLKAVRTPAAHRELQARARCSHRAVVPSDRRGTPHLDSSAPESHLWSSGLRRASHLP